mgnify:CR=1 FL=1|jgi:hypothetical protein|nr:MAG TPA: helix-turn-helix domain protein [Caudoviricetes sp.]
MTQKERILKHLQDFGSITSWEAIKEYGCTRLSAYIYLLRKDGYIIENENVTTKNRYGDAVTFAKYQIKI